MTQEGRYLIDKLIPQRDLIVAWGTPKSGKTFWALDIAFHIAMGKPYRGKKVVQGPVLYCAFEGQHGLRDRVTAYHMHHKGSDEAPLWLMLNRMTFTRPTNTSLRKHREVIELCLAEGVKPVLVILDTLNRSLDGSESSDEDMTFYTKAAEEICDAFNCATLIVHHCGVNQERPRGHTSLTGTCSCQIAIRRETVLGEEDRVMSAQVEYIKDGPEGPKQFSYLRPIQIGSDEDGNIISSCVIEAAPDDVVATGQKAGGGFLSSQAVKALAILQPMSQRADDGWVRLADWREACMRSNISASKNVESKRKAFLRALDQLNENNKIVIKGEMVKSLTQGVTK